MNRNQMLALLALKAYTAGRFDIWILAGSAKATCRQHVMTVLLNGEQGKNIPQAKCGVNALRDALYSIANVTGECEAHREDNFIAWAKQQTADMTYAQYKAA